MTPTATEAPNVPAVPLDPETRKKLSVTANAMATRSIL